MRIFFSGGRVAATLSWVLSGLFFLIFLSSCDEDPGFLGKDLLPEGDNIHTYSDTITQIHAWTIDSKPVLTGYNNQLLLGSIVDSVFGFSKADFILPLFAASPKDPGENLTIDSIIFELIIDRHFGDSATTHTIKIYEFTDSLALDSAYLSDYNPEGHYRPTEIGEKTITGYSDTIKIAINELQFNAKIRNASAETYKTDSAFRKVFKGLYVTTEAVNEKGSLLFVDSLLNSSRVYLYYKNDSIRDNNISTSLVYPMGFNYTAAKINMFTNNYSGFRAGMGINDPESTDTLAFIASMGMMDTRLVITNLERLKADPGKIVINKAELILPVEKSLSVSEKAFPPRLLLWIVDQGGNYDYLYDYSIDATQNKTVFNGIYEYIEKDRYIFNISRHLQAYLDGSIDDLEFILRPTLNSQSAFRTILKKQGSSSNPMKLIIVYTELY